MKLQYAPFLLPLWPESPEQEMLNRFIRGHKIIQTRKELVSQEGRHHWAILVEYLDTPEKEAAETGKNRVDYKEILSVEDFALFSRLREVRKRLAEENGLPVYAVCTNEQLAEIARKKPAAVSEGMKIEGIGQGKGEKYLPAFIACIIGIQNSNSPSGIKDQDGALQF
jgi:superfamily II DNA helicase RecQ